MKKLINLQKECLTIKILSSTFKIFICFLTHFQFVTHYSHFNLIFNIIMRIHILLLNSQ